MGNRGLSPPGGGGAAPSTEGLVPLGGIIMWSGTIADIPTDWALCDGSANSPGPDLRDKFVVCATADDGGVAKTNIEGSLQQTGGVTGHSHSGHANLTHAGGAVGDHTGLTHGLTIANHPDLTHAALSHAASTFTHADHSVASFTGSHASVANLSMPSGSIASHNAGSMPSQSHTHASIAGVASFASGTNRSGRVSQPTETGSDASLANLSGPSRSFASHAAGSAASASHTHAAVTLTHEAHSFPSLSHQAIGTHVGTDYGVHTFTAPTAHGTAGTVTHSFTQPNDHAISSHDTVSTLPNYFALAFIQRMA